VKYLGGIPLSSEEQRAFSLGSTGLPVPYTLDPTVLPVSNSVVNPLRAISSVEQIVGSNEWRGLTSGAITASRQSEGTEATDNTPTLAQPTIATSKAHCFVPFSIESGQDWTGMDTALARLIADAKDDEEATAFASGNGTPPNPFGVLTGATGTTAASTGLTIAAANLYSLEGALAPRFRPRAQFVANRAMYNIIRGLDTAGGAQMWLRIGELLPNNPASEGGQGNTGLRLLGYPVNELSTMSATVVNATKIMLLGDFSYFKIIDRVGMTVELIPHLFGATSRYPVGQRGFYAYWRNGSKVIDAAAFRALTGTT
jgi:HK97 family phage major capsid protein